MKPFELESSMLTMRGVFYPTGYMFLMFDSEDGARAAEQALEDGGISGDEISLLSPNEIQEKVVRTVGDSQAMPSAGTESDTVRQIAQLAGQGHHAVLVHAPDAKDSEKVMELLKDSKLTFGQKYRHLVIEDLV